MSKIFDITDKLSFSENPVIMVNGVKIEVNTNALDILRIIDVMESGTTAQSLTAIVDTLFPTAKEKIKGLNLSMNGLQTLIKEAISLAMGTNSTEGETQTPAMT